MSNAHRVALAAAMATPPVPPAGSPPQAGAMPAPLVVTLPPSAFSQTWKGRPTEPARIGLRLVSETSNDKARANATASSDRLYPETSRDSDAYVEHWNGQLIRGVLAEAVCQPHDVATSWFKAMAADMIGAAFTDKGLLRLWHGYAELGEKLSPLLPVATDEEILDLSTRLSLAAVTGRIHQGDRRILRRILDDLRATE